MPPTRSSRESSYSIAARAEEREKAERVHDVREQRLRRGDAVRAAARGHRAMCMAGARRAPFPRDAAPHAPVVIVVRLRAVDTVRSAASTQIEPVASARRPGTT